MTKTFTAATMPQQASLLRFLGVILFCCSALLLLSAEESPAQITLTGRMTDSLTHEPIPFAAVAIVGHNEGGITDTDGYFRIQTFVTKGELRFSAVGYAPLTIAYSGTQHLYIVLTPTQSVIDEVTIKPRKGRYRNKDNPAVALIRQVIAHKDENRLSSYDHVQYQEYDKTVMAYENPGSLMKKTLIAPKYRFVFQNIDTTTIVGKELLPLYLEEYLYDKYVQRSPPKEQSVLVANKKITLDERYANNESLSKVLQYIYQDIDLYDNTIFLLTNHFLSPVAPLAPQFYRYYITDTLTNDQHQKVVKLAFEPRNDHDLLFYGVLYIALNGHYSLTKARVSLPKLANVNWLNSFHSSIEYAPDPSGKYYLKKTEVGIEFGLSPIRQGIYGGRTRIISHFDTRTPIPDSVFKIQPPVSTEDSAYKKSDAFWISHRPEPLTAVEQRVYTNMDSLRRMPSFNRAVSWASFLFGGYKNIGPVEIGPWNTFLSYNTIEGFKPRFGGRTTDAFSKRFYFSGNIAYGFNDQRWKYYGSAAYSFNKRNAFYGYPQHYFQVSEAFDSRLPGRSFTFEDEDNPFLSIKRGENDKYLYDRVFRADYVNELIPHLRFDLQYEYRRLTPAGSLYFIGDSSSDTLTSLTTSGFGLDIRWAPHEKFLIGRRPGRNYIPSKYPVIEAGVKTGIKDLYGGDYDYRQYTLSVSKRFYLSRLGYADVALEGGYIDGKLPYPLLFTPPANQTYNLQEGSFNLMNYLEFISDQYASININYHMKGLLLNNIPGIRWLRLREVAGFKAIYGGLSPENASERSHLPVDENGQPVTFTYGNQPYMEFNVGIENIFNVLRIDYVRRLNYLHHPDVSPDGVRIAIDFTF